MIQAKTAYIDVAGGRLHSEERCLEEVERTETLLMHVFELLAGAQLRQGGLLALLAERVGSQPCAPTSCSQKVFHWTGKASRSLVYSALEAVDLRLKLLNGGLQGEKSAIDGGNLQGLSGSLLYELDNLCSE